MKRVHLWMALMVSVLASVLFVFVAAFIDFYQSPLIKKDRILSISPGTTLGQFTQTLKKAGDLNSESIIDEAYFLKWLAHLEPEFKGLRVGDYQLKKGMKPKQVLALISSGKIVQFKQTIVPGDTFKQVLAKLKSNPAITSTLENQDIAIWLKQLSGGKYTHPEGLFFAETYHFPRGTNDRQFLERSYLDLEHYLEKEWPKRDKNEYITTPYQALILASIVEKETAVGSERPLIAGVFLNRLRKNMRLQTDPTVIYGIGDDYQGNITKAHLRKKTPYNTYVIKGLPPTPIAVVSAEAIDAVLHPQKTEALYFVAKGGGHHYFSKSYSEHRKAVVKYLLKGNAKKYQGSQ